MNLYGIIIFLSTLAAWQFLNKKILTHKETGEWQYLFTILFVFGVAGARIYHVLDYWQYYSENFTEIFMLGNGGLGVWGAIIFCLFALFFWSKKHHSSLLSTTDKLALGLPLAQALGRFANFVNHEGFGYPSQLPWTQKIPLEFRPTQYMTSERFHPSWVYESILSFALFFFLYRYYRKHPQQSSGTYTALYLIGYGTIRLLVEFTRFDTWQLGGLKVAQILSAVSVLLGLFLLAKPRKNC